MFFPVFFLKLFDIFFVYGYSFATLLRILTEKEPNNTILSSLDQMRNTTLFKLAEIGAAGAIATFALAGCGDQTSYYQANGVVELGANGKKYIIPKDAKRPIYKTEAACVADVTKEIKLIDKKDSVTLKDTPAKLCTPIHDYADRDNGNSAFPYYLYYYYYYGPIMSGGSTWHSSSVAYWQTSIPNGTFASSDSGTQEGIESAPEDDSLGEDVTEEENGENLGDNPESYSDGSENESDGDSGDESSGEGDSSDDGGDFSDDGGDDSVDAGGDYGLRKRLTNPKGILTPYVLTWGSANTVVVKKKSAKIK